MMKTPIRFTMILILICLSRQASAAQSVCVIKQQTTGYLQGIISLVEKTNSLEGATIKLMKKNEGKDILKETTTNNKGYFELGQVKEGRYLLKVSYPEAVDLYVPVRLNKRKQKRKLQITLGVFVDEVCGGGSVSLVD